MICNPYDNCNNKIYVFNECNQIGETQKVEIGENIFNLINQNSGITDIILPDAEKGETVSIKVFGCLLAM